MTTALFSLRPVDPGRDFPQMVEMLRPLEAVSLQSLARWHGHQVERGLPLEVVVDAADRCLGYFSLGWRSGEDDGQFDLELLVDPAHRGQGAGQTLYAAMLEKARELKAARLFVRIVEGDAHSLAFAQHRGFTQRSHGIEMRLALTHFDSAAFDPLIERLRGEGFRFTHMAELGDTEEARRRLYHLNNTTGATIPGSDGVGSWPTFEEFDKTVCQALWYRPEGQVVAIDIRANIWAAMSAITRFDGADYAYNLFTGVDVAYRGRGLGQAVKVLALRYAAHALGVTEIRTHHNSLNAPMIAIDRKLGYVQSAGVLGLVKDLQQASGDRR